VIPHNYRPLLRPTVLLTALFIGLVTPTPVAHATASPSASLCSSYFGVVSCYVVGEPPPERPTTQPGMRAVATPRRIGIDGSTLVIVGPAKNGGTGFIPGEVVRIYEFQNGKATEFRASVKFADGTGTVRFSRGFLSLPGVDQSGRRILCARGERSLRIGCTGVTIGNGVATKELPNKKALRQPLTSDGIQATLNLTSVQPGDKLVLTAMPLPGSSGFKKREDVFLIAFFNGKRVSLDLFVKAKNDGSAVIDYVFAEVEGANIEGAHTLCAYGIESRKSACAQFSVFNADGVITKGPEIPTPSDGGFQVPIPA